MRISDWSSDVCSSDLNGMPWWYFHNFNGPLDGTRLKSLDPSGLLERHIPGGRIVGCVVYPAAAITEPGVVKHVEGDRFPLGELDGSASERVQRLHRSEEHTSELQSLMRISYAVFCLKKKKRIDTNNQH